MFKKIAILAVLMCSVIAIRAQESKGIQFEHSAWKDILAKAKTGNKLVMLDAYTSWCGPCKWMSKTIFTKEEVGTFYNANFINAKFDMEKGEGIELAKQYGVRAYPTLLYINGNGEVVHRICGSREAADFIAEGKIALDDRTNYSAIKKSYQANPKEKAVIFFEAANNACEDVSNDLAVYFKSLSKDELLQAPNFGLAYTMINYYVDPAFPVFHSNYSAYGSKYGSDTLDKKLQGIYEGALERANYDHDAKKVEEIRASYAVIKNKDVKDYLDAVASFAAIDQEKDAKGYYAKQAEFVDKFLYNDPNKLNEYAWDYYETVTDKALLEKACTWASNATRLRADSYAFTDTYAAVLYKLGKKTEAKKAAEAAIAIAKKNDEDCKETEALLKKINALK